MNKTLDYYNTNAALFTENTINVEMSGLQNTFTEMLPTNGTILDLGCGTGRDSLSFSKAGFSVVSVDGSEEMCKVASKLLGHDIICSLFENYDTDISFDGIWACSSLLHVEKSNLAGIIGKYARMLKPEGIFYMSFKYGDFFGEKNGRYFTDLNEEELAKIIENVPELELIKSAITFDVRPERSSERWLNAFYRRK